eukprot:973814-Rhodomonas_salina.4
MVLRFCYVTPSTELLYGTGSATPCCGTGCFSSGLEHRGTGCLGARVSSYAMCGTELLYGAGSATGMGVASATPGDPPP